MTGHGVTCRYTKSITASFCTPTLVAMSLLVWGDKAMPVAYHVQSSVDACMSTTVQEMTLHCGRQLCMAGCSGSQKPDINRMSSLLQEGVHSQRLKTISTNNPIGNDLITS